MFRRASDCKLLTPTQLQQVASFSHLCLDSPSVHHSPFPGLGANHASSSVSSLTSVGTVASALFWSLVFAVTHLVLFIFIFCNHLLRSSSAPFLFRSRYGIGTCSPPSTRDPIQAPFLQEGVVAEITAEKIMRFAMKNVHGILLSAYHESLPLAPSSLATPSKSGLGNPEVCLRQVMMKVKSSATSFLGPIAAL